MIIALSFVALLILLLGHIVMVVELRDAIEAREDENGFQIVWHNNKRDQQDVACVWKERSEEQAAPASGGLHAAA